MSFTHAKKRLAFSKKRSPGTGTRQVYFPKPYMKESIRFGVSRAAAGFFLAPGLGKTGIAYFIFKILKKLKLVDELMVLAKRRIIYEVWPQELRKWKQLEGFKYRTLHGSKKALRIRKPSDIWLLNFDGLIWLVNTQKWFFKRGKKIMLVVDESSKLRNTKTKRFRMLRKILGNFVRRYILTGSPTPNGLMNIFGQIYVLDLGRALGEYITQFRGQYFKPSGYMGYEWTLLPGAEKRIYKRVRNLVLRYGTDQLKLPPLTFIDRLVRLPPDARKLYDDMEHEYVMQIKEGEVVAANAAVASGKCRQIANGGVFYDKSGGIVLDPTSKEGRKRIRGWKRLHDAKCEDLIDLLDELQGEPALVAIEYHHDKFRIQRYCKKFARQYSHAPFVDASMKDREFREVKRQWDRGELPVMFGNPDSIAQGLNLQGQGGIVIFFALTWNLENYEQFFQRVWRQGQKRRVLVYRIIARNTVDEVMVESLKVKDHNQQTLLNAMERRHGIRKAA